LGGVWATTLVEKQAARTEEGPGGGSILRALLLIASSTQGLNPGTISASVSRHYRSFTFAESAKPPVNADHNLVDVLPHVLIERKAAVSERLTVTPEAHMVPLNKS